MSSNLQIEQLNREDKTIVFLKGKIDEYADFSQANLEQMATIFFDFKDVSMINSVGIQSWIAFLKQVPPKTQVAFCNCPLRIVNQMNLFPDFMAGRKIFVLSFFAPYYCETCDDTFTFLLSVKNDFPRGQKLSMPKRQCETCQSALAFGAVEEKYLLFLKRGRAA